MAKGKKKEKEGEDTPEMVSPADFANQVLKGIRSDYGNGISVSGRDAADKSRITVSWSPGMNLITGGIEEGSWVGITGNEKTGKSTAALTLARNCQLPEFGGRPVFYLDTEYRIGTKNLIGIEGLNIEEPFFNLIRSEKGKILTAEDFLDIGERAIRNVPGCILIIDSVSALCGTRVLNGEIGAETRGSGAKLFANWIDRNAQVVPVNDCIVIGITHLISNTSGMGSPYMERAARRWRYQVDYQIRSRQTTDIIVKEEKVGMIVNWESYTSKSTTPGTKGETVLRFGIGLDKVDECIKLGSDANLIKKNGAWFTLSYMQRYLHLLGVDEWSDDVEKSVKAQGAEKLYQMLRENPEWANALEHEIMVMMGLRKAA